MKKYLILLGLVFAIIGCEDELDRTPNDALISETAFETVDDLEDGVNGIYTNFNPNFLVGFNTTFTDNGKLGLNNGGQSLNLLNQVLNTQTNSGQIWSSRYATANDCNRIIAAAEGVDVNPNEQELFNNLLAQAYGMRAYAHYDALLYYGEDLTDPTALGVPYQDEVRTEGNLARLTTEDTKNRIIEDLNTANSLLASGFDDRFSVTKDFVSFLKARVSLITEDWGAVISNTDDFINDYPLADQQQYQDMFAGDADATEVIFAYDNVSGFNRNLAGQFRFTASTTDNSYIEMSNELFNELTSAADVRFAVNVDQESAFGDGEIAINKYPAIGGLFINDYKIFRVSEAYLMRAEAFAHQDQFQNAADEVQAVKNARAGTQDNATAYDNLVDAITNIKRERRLELCFEGHRYIDSKRYRNIVNEGIVRADEDCEGGIPCEIAVSSRKFTFPLPQAEINGNVDIKQNPQWE